MLVLVDILTFDSGIRETFPMWLIPFKASELPHREDFFLFTMHTLGSRRSWVKNEYGLACDPRKQFDLLRWINEITQMDLHLGTRNVLPNLSKVKCRERRNVDSMFRFRKYV